MTFNVLAQTTQPTRASTQKMLRELKNNDADFEWYPTDEKQIQCVREDLLKECEERHGSLIDFSGNLQVSLLDVGAGDGRVLKAITNGAQYAIEKSVELVRAMDPSITLVGGDFIEQSLIDKKVDCVYSNPPYSMFEWWATKVIKEANAALVYLVLPKRWVDSTTIMAAIKARHASYTVIGSFDYKQAHRQARAEVEVIKITLGRLRYSSRVDSRTEVDPFDLWFNEQFPLDLPTEGVSEFVTRMNDIDACRQQRQANQALIKRDGVIRTLVTLYNKKMDDLLSAYGHLNTIDPALFRELGVNIESIKSSIRLKVSSLKDAYWNELIDSLDSITNKMCTSTREKFKKRLKENTSVEFTEQNAVLITLWIINQADTHYEQQFLDLYAKITNSASIIKYKSNQKTLRDDRWRYTDGHEKFGRYALDYRIVLEYMGGLPSFTKYETTTGTNVLNDLLTVSEFLGFDSIGNTLAHQRLWLSGRRELFYFFNHTTQEKEVLFEAKMFIKGTMHLRMHPLFIQKMNVVHGRLMGWLRTAQEAADEFDLPIEVADAAFSTNLMIAAKSTQILLTHQETNTHTQLPTTEVM